MLKKYVNYLLKGIYAGVMIGIGGVIFLALDNKIIGATFFSIGLLVVCMFGMNLYTGKIGYIINNKISYVIELLLSLIGNFIGTFLVAFAILNTRFSSITEKAKILSNIKLNDNVVSILILSFFCGILMYIAVNSYKTCKDNFGKYICIFMGVIVFILSGFEHCVANMFYFSMAEVWTWKTVLYTLVMVLGNSLGSVFIALFDKYIRE